SASGAPSLSRWTYCVQLCFLWPKRIRSETLIFCGKSNTGAGVADKQGQIRFEGPGPSRWPETRGDRAGFRYCVRKPHSEEILGPNLFGSSQGRIGAFKKGESRRLRACPASP